MTAQILDGKATAAEIRSALAVRVAALAERGIVPGLGAVLAGDDPGSRSYVNGKHRDCAEVGIASIRRELPATATRVRFWPRSANSTTIPRAPDIWCSYPFPQGSTRRRYSSASGRTRTRTARTR